MTTTATAPAPAVAPQPPVPEAIVPALLHDESGFYRIVNGKRIQINEPGLAVLDGTPAEAAYEAAASLNAAITALQRQYDAQVEIIKTAVGHKKVALLHGRKVLTWGWSTRKTLDRAIAEALLTPEQYAVVEQESQTRSFEPAYRK